jgi:hypothetical protein
MTAPAPLAEHRAGAGLRHLRHRGGLARQHLREVQALHPGVDGDAFARAWRAGYQPAMARVRSGELGWTLIDDLHR